MAAVPVSTMNAAIADRAFTRSAAPEGSTRNVVPMNTAPEVIYFSSTSGNTHRFIEKLDMPARRIPLFARDAPLLATRPYVLIVPTYGGGNGMGAVPKQVIRFLNNEGNRSLIRGVIAAGNTNFGSAYGLAGDIIAAKTRVPHLHRFEIFGTPDDVRIVRDGLETL